MYVALSRPLYLGCRAKGFLGYCRRQVHMKGVWLCLRQLRVQHLVVCTTPVSHALHIVEVR